MVADQEVISSSGFIFWVVLKILINSSVVQLSYRLVPADICKL
jgi:hypothetical protein